MTTASNRPRVLFVDDEESVLLALGNVLRKDRHRWDVGMALGAEAALEDLARRPADVVVSDMRMPGIDGAELLGRVQRLYPGTARLVLSGHAERDALVRAMPVAHQFLTKPCDAAVLRATLERACSVARLLTAEPVRRFASGLGALPPAPAVYTQLVAVLSSPRASMHGVGHVIERDPAVAAKVLALAQSALFSRGQAVQTIGQAVARLGLDLVKALVLSIGATTTSLVDPRVRSELDRLQAHGLAVARIAKHIAPPEHAAVATTAAVLHDIGRLVLVTRLPDAWLRIHDRVVGGVDPARAEVEEVGADHAAIGAYVLGAWGVALPVVETVAWHHAPAGRDAATVAVHVADALASGHPHGVAPAIDPAIAADPAIAPCLDAWRALARAEIVEGAS